ncbi:hypothetical protein GCM10027074_09650 [Streptomyces deserti]
MTATVPPPGSPRAARPQIASGAGAPFALAGAKCERRLPARHGPAPEVPRPNGHGAYRSPHIELPCADRRDMRHGGAVRELRIRVHRIRFHPDHSERAGGYR